jgi:hypothetical protein
MKQNKVLFVLILALFAVQGISFAQYETRQDVIWARMVPAGTITLDGNLNEAAWDQAESVDVIYGTPGPLPTSAWRPEFQEEAYTDPTHATVKFLTSDDNQLYLGFIIPDSSIGGIQDWARWDGILMSVKDKLDETRPALAVEYFYTWWYVNIEPLILPGAPPRFIGRYGNFDDTTRTPEQIEAWDAVTVVNGMSNDAGRDESWVVEMRVNLNNLGYDVTAPGGDIVAMNFSIWDCDYLFEGDPAAIASARTWFQSPWGNANANNVARVFARPDVTTSTTTLPVVMPDVVLPNGDNLPAPVIDGMLDEEVWGGAYKFNIAWGDEALRNSYPTAGPLSSGQFQPEIGGNPRPPVVDPSFATIKMFFRDNYLYMAADVNDQVVQGSDEFDRIDGVQFILGDPSSLNDDNMMIFRRLRVNFDASGDPQAYEYLPVLIDSNAAEFAVALKGGTTVNNHTDVDSGYTIEMRVDMTHLGYSARQQDILLFAGVMLADGDSFDDPLADYGTRTWWFREHDGGPAAAWIVLDPNLPVGVDDNQQAVIPDRLELYGNYPNPFNPGTKIKFSIPEMGNVSISVFNAIGQEIKAINYNSTSSGPQEYYFDASDLTSGVYLYKVTFRSSSNSIVQTNSGKMVLIK